jgi:hypothetical protein
VFGYRQAIGDGPVYPSSIIVKMLQPTQDSGLIMLINAGDPCQWTYLRNLSKQTILTNLSFFFLFCAKFRPNAKNEKEYDAFLM